jgi:hypothetical protein
MLSIFYIIIHEHLYTPLIRLDQGLQRPAKECQDQNILPLAFSIQIY